VVETIDEELFAALAADPLAAHLGITLEEIRPGYARASMAVRETTLNAVGTAHGGATMALIDVVHAAVSNSHGTVAVAQSVHTEFLTAGRPGDTLVAEGNELHRSSRAAVYLIEVRAANNSGGGDRPVATALARVFRLDRAWADEIAIAKGPVSGREDTV
jgi:acyl-CoA thioesterase